MPNGSQNSGASVNEAGELSTANSFPIFTLYTGVGLAYCFGFVLVFWLVLHERNLTIVHILAGITLLGNYFVLRKTKNFVAGNAIVLAAGTTIIASLFITGGWADNGHFWAFAYLPYAFYLAGHKRSYFWVGVLYALIGGAVVLHYAGIILLPYSTLTLINFGLAFVTFTICLFLLQFAMAKYAALVLSQVQEIRVINADLAAQKEKIEADKAKDEALLASLSDGMLVTDAAGEPIELNGPARKLLDIADGAPVQGILRRLNAYEEGKGQLVSDAIATMQAIRLGRGVTQVLECIHANGTKATITMVATPVVLQGKVVGALAILRDTTKEREVDRMKTEFISLASHQLRTPLSAIRWFVEMLLTGDAGKLTAQQSEFVKNVADSTDRMIALVGSLLNISRIESGRIIVDPKPTDVGKLIHGVVGDLEDKIATRGQTVVVSVAAEMQHINLDPDLVGQVYMNLLTNAVKYTPKHGEIMVIVSRKDGYVLSQVSDNGYGIPESEQPKLFTKFFRADNVKKIETDGNGLGLYLIKTIVESSGGKIWFESKEGKGTTFWFSLPMSGMKPRAGEVRLEV